MEFAVIASVGPHIPLVARLCMVTTQEDRDMMEINRLSLLGPD